MSEGLLARTRVRIEIDGLLAVHAVRAVWTTLASVPGVVTADVSMRGALLEIEGPVSPEALERSLALALEQAGVALRSMVLEQQRILPIA